MLNRVNRTVKPQMDVPGLFFEPCPPPKRTGTLSLLRSGNVPFFSLPVHMVVYLIFRKENTPRNNSALGLTRFIKTYMYGFLCVTTILAD